MKIDIHDHENEYDINLEGCYHSIEWIIHHKYQDDDNEKEISFGILEFYDDEEPFMYIKVRRFENGYITGVCRISLYDATYVEGYNENFRLSEDEKKILVEGLITQKHRSKYIDNPFPIDITNWNYIFWYFDNLLDSYGKEKYFYKEDNVMPDYSKLPT